MCSSVIEMDFDDFDEKPPISLLNTTYLLRLDAVSILNLLPICCQLKQVTITEMCKKYQLLGVGPCQCALCRSDTLTLYVEKRSFWRPLPKPELLSLTSFVESVHIHDDH